MKSSEILNFIDQQGHKIFSVSFVKRSDGSIREMTCRKFVAKFLRGGVKKFDDNEKGLVTVFDMSREKMAYRSFGLEAVFLIKGSGRRHIIEDFDKKLINNMDEYNKLVYTDAALFDMPLNEITVDVSHNECEHCLANNGRAGTLTKNPAVSPLALCQNCYTTLKTGKITLMTNLVRTDEELVKTCEILDPVDESKNKKVMD